MAKGRGSPFTRSKTRHAHSRRAKRKPYRRWSLDAVKHALLAWFTNAEEDSGVSRASCEKVANHFGVPRETLHRYAGSMRRELGLDSFDQMKRDRRHWGAIKRYVERLELRRTGPPAKLPEWFDAQLAQHIVKCDTEGTPLSIGFFLRTAATLAQHFKTTGKIRSSDVPCFDSHWLKRFLERHASEVCLSHP